MVAATLERPSSSKVAVQTQRRFLEPGRTRIIHVSKITEGKYKGEKITVVREYNEGTRFGSGEPYREASRHGWAFLGLAVDGPSRMILDEEGLDYTGTNLFIETEAAIEGQLVDFSGQEELVAEDRDGRIELSYHCGWGVGAKG